MRKLVLIFALLATFAFAYEPTLATQIEINEAAAFTNGFVVDCPGNIVEVISEVYTAGYWMVCVDTSDTPWSPTELVMWSEFGLSHWTILRAWQRYDQGLYTTLLYNPRRGEALALYVIEDRYVVYVAVSVREDNTVVGL